MFWLFKGKKEVEKVKEETRKGFDSVKKDINAVGEWIKHLNIEKNSHKKEIIEVKEVLSMIKEEIENIKNLVNKMNEVKIRQTSKTGVYKNLKQTPVFDVGGDVQTSVQTPNLDSFSITERAIIWILLNTDMKLSYEDLASILKKEKSTIRGQINSIKQKSEILKEKVEKNGKKRVYIPEEIKEKILKKSKVRVNSIKKSKKGEEY